jgi:catechol 2,3-dioxygenase-like lactoylglutathione lyase family enzyme
MSINLNQITIPVLDVEKAGAFYEKLGLKWIVHALPHYARFESPIGDATFSLHQVSELPQGNGIWIYFEVEKLDEYIETLMEQGFIFEELPNDKNWLWREARLKDLDNHQIILYHAGEYRKNPPWRV